MDENCLNTLKEMKDLKVPFSSSPMIYGEFDFELGREGTVSMLESDLTIDLDANNGCEISQNSQRIIAAYDESIMTFSALEGKAVCVSHSLVYVGKNNYLPINYITLKFYTRSSIVQEKMGAAILVKDVAHQSLVDTACNKMDFLEKYGMNDSILLIDGPLIAGDAYTTFMPAIKKFLERNIIACFFVKNSSSDLISTYMPDICVGYNSDMHWVHRILKPGQRTSFFKYTDNHNKENSKVFCYMKFFHNSSPVRIEFPTIIFENFKNEMQNIVDLAYYFLLVQGSKSNAQLRPIAIAEMFARETLKLFDVNKEIRNAQLVPTMNEERWGEK